VIRCSENQTGGIGSKTHTSAYDAVVFNIVKTRLSKSEAPLKS